MSLLYILLALCPATLAERQGYAVCYDAVNQRALWTIHQPSPSQTPSKRKHWLKDRELNSLPAKAFTNTGFDRGHLASSADLPESEDTFLTSNAIAQDPALNRGPWRKLENQIRRQRATLVITGAIYNHCGNEMIEAPCLLYKIALLPDGQIITKSAHNANPIDNSTKINNLQ